MALDGAFLYTVKRELEFLIGGKVDKVHQPSREELLISIRVKGGIYKLLICVSASSSRVHVTNVNIDNPKTPTMFCMFMRKHLGGGKLVNIRQDGLERILFFDFECMNELGDMVTLTLACEIMGRYSNMILINQNGKVMDSLKRVDAEMSRERLVLPNVTYELPPRDSRLNFLTATPEEIVQSVKALPNGDLAKSLIKVFEGVSPILCREWAYYVGKGSDLKTFDMVDEHFDRLVFTVNKSKEAILSGKLTFTAVKTKDGQLKDFSFIDIHQYGTLMVTKQFDNAFELLDYFYSQRDSYARLKQRADDLFKLLVNTSERITKKISIQQEELANCDSKELSKLYGDLLSANMYRVSKGDSVAVVENFYDENCPTIEIPLDVRKTPSQNAQHYYSEYKKATTAQEKLTEQIALAKDELQYIDSVFDALTRAETENEVIQLRLELAQQGYIKSNKLKGKPPKELPPLEFKSDDGYTILVGRNNSQNDRLTTKVASKLDIWLHVHNITGSHVVVLTNGETPPDSTIEDACNLAVYHSRAKTSSQVPVDYCLVKYVKKPNGAKPGMVIFTHNKTAYITPDEDRIERLRSNVKSI
jgi:predicted ribosome quality control (RQC) complex YloA/Tae2 family protein